MLAQYEPQTFFYWFEKIMQIPRPSFHEEQICDFLESFAKRRGLWYNRDRLHNILMRVPASAGYEQEPPLLLQAHTDMITEKDDGVDFDFFHEPIRLKITGNELHAAGTTLGADDGSGMAIMLAVADTPALPHPELELLFTSQEEVGMGGIQQFDFTQIHSRRMINLDCGRMHNISVSSAGAMTAVIEEQFGTEPQTGAAIRLVLRGGTGGHSGLEIHKNRACAANLLGELLTEVGKKHPCRLISITAAHQPILSEIEAMFAVKAAQISAVTDLLTAGFETSKARYSQSDPSLCCEIAVEDCGVRRALSEYDSLRVAKLLYLLRTGAKKRDADDPKIVLSSAAVAAVKLLQGSFSLSYAIRAVEDTEKALQGQLVKELVDLLQFAMTITKSYPGWTKSVRSEIVPLVDRVHRRLFGEPPAHQYIHGGTEVGMILGVIPQMDAVGAIPSMANAHTTRELLYLDQVPDFWRLITAVLAEKTTRSPEPVLETE